MQNSSNILAATTVAPARESFLPDVKDAPGGKSTQFIELMQRALAAAPRHVARQPSNSPVKARSSGERQPVFEPQRTGRRADAIRVDRAGVGSHLVKAAEGTLECPLAQSHSDSVPTETETGDDSDLEMSCDEPVVMPVAILNPTVMPVVCAPAPAPEATLPSEVEVPANPSYAGTAAPVADAEAESVSPQVSAELGAEADVSASGENPPAGRTESVPASLAGEAGSNPAITTSKETGETAAAGTDVAFESTTVESMVAAPDGPPVQVKTPATTPAQPPLEGDGTSAAQGVVAMKKAEQQNEFAAPEKEMPGDEPLSPGPGPGASHAPRADKHESVISFNGPAIESISSRSAVVNEASLVNVTADHRISALERTHEVIAMHALRLREANAESLQIVLKPGGGLELSLELRQHEGAIEARAAMQSGDFNHLNRHWADLQQRLEARGIRLAPLTCAEHFLNSNTNNFQQQPGRTPKDEAPAVGVFPKFTPATSPVITAVPQSARTTGRGWESWA